MRPGLWCSLVLDSNCAPLCRVASLLFLAFSLHEAHGRGHERTGPEGDTAGGYIRLCVPGLSPARVTLGVRLFHMFGFVLPHGAETRSRNAKHFTKASLVPPPSSRLFRHSAPCRSRLVLRAGTAPRRGDDCRALHSAGAGWG